jgi:predicted nucleic acid-binding protein
MKPIVVSDAGPLIALAKLDLLSLLPQIFSTVYIPKTVFEEATKNQHREDAQRIASFKSPQINLVDNLQNSFTESLKILLDDGEIQALSHAKTLDCGVLMDEKRGRQVAVQHNIPIIGVIGVLLQAKEKGLIPEIKMYLKALQDADYRLSDALLDKALGLAGE